MIILILSALLIAGVEAMELKKAKQDATKVIDKVIDKAEDFAYMVNDCSWPFKRRKKGDINFCNFQ